MNTHDQSTTPRRRGRPPRGTTPLDLDTIVDAAAALLAEGAGTVSMRAVAQRLGVDAMALYHHVANHEALMHALVDRRFGSLDPARPPFAGTATPVNKVLALCERYLALAVANGPLVSLLAAGKVDAGLPARRFRQLFDAAVAELPLSRPTRTRLHDALVDLLHGAALAGPQARFAPLRAPIRWLVEGAAQAKGRR